MAGLSVWQLVRDLVIGCALLAGYAWLAMLSVRLRAMHRRLATHLCRDDGEHASVPGRITVAEILLRESADPSHRMPSSRQ